MPAVAIVAAGASLFGGAGAAGLMAAASFTSVAGLAAGATLVGSVATLAGGIAAATGNKDGNKWMQTGSALMLAGSAGNALAGPATPAAGTPADTAALNANNAAVDASAVGDTGMLAAPADTAVAAVQAPVATGVNGAMTTPLQTATPAPMTAFEAAQAKTAQAAVDATNNATQQAKYGMLAKAGGDVMSGMAAEEQAKWQNDQLVAAAALKREQELRNRALLNAQQTSYRNIGR